MDGLNSRSNPQVRLSSMYIPCHRYTNDIDTVVLALVNYRKN